MSGLQAWIPYCGAAPSPTEWLGRWNFDLWVLVPLALLMAVIFRLPTARQRWLGVSAVAVLAVSFVSPLCALSSALFAARTVHHTLLVVVAAPLLAAAFPRPARGALWATLAQAVVFWSWHAPGAYDAALSNDLVYGVMQLTILGSSLWFWLSLRQVADLSAVAFLLVAMVAMGLLGALLTFAPAPLYAPHVLAAELWGIGALRDQQLAGLIMWAPAAGAYLAAALVRLSRVLKPSPQGQEATAR